MSRADQFFIACTQLPYPETRDERGEYSLPELSRLSAKLDGDYVDDAIEYGRGLMRHYPDNDWAPTIVGTLLIQRGRPEEVVDVLRESLPRCPRKYRLYSMAAQADLARNQLSNASVWWSRSAIAQCQIIDYQVYLPFYYLAHIALVLEAFHEAEAFFSMAAAIEPKAPHLSPALEERLDTIRQQWVAEPLHRVVQYIETNFLRSQD
jgi:tetratricopeptide (TPR) repeat protein